MLTIFTDTIAQLGFDLDKAIAVYQDALAQWQLTVGVPAPAAHPLVEQIVKEYGGKYIAVEPETGVSPADPNSLTNQIAALSAQLAAVSTKLDVVSTKVDAISITPQPATP